MTREEAVAQIAATRPISEADINGILDCSPDEIALLVQATKDRGAMPDASAWDVVLDVLRGCLEVAAVVSPLGGAIETVYGVGKL